MSEVPLNFGGLVKIELIPKELAASDLTTLYGT